MTPFIRDFERCVRCERGLVLRSKKGRIELKRRIDYLNMIALLVSFAFVLAGVGLAIKFFICRGSFAEALIGGKLFVLAVVSWFLVLRKNRVCLIYCIKKDCIKSSMGGYGFPSGCFVSLNVAGGHTLTPGSEGKESELCYVWLTTTQYDWLTVAKGDFTCLDSVQSFAAKAKIPFIVHEDEQTDRLQAP